ncbi:MAG: FtsX-like permease family protein [Candidatus Stygibacter frigidus]|nr:FtsX-like permease family protein [Candidatus Stygibacter frigidus]
MILKLAWRNIIGGGFRTWLNVFILSLVLVAIIGFHGLYIGWQQDAEDNSIKWHIAGGQYWQQKYDPYDAFSFEDSRAPLPEALNESETVGFLVSQGVIYPNGRMKNIIIKGVKTDQQILDLPTEYLTYEPGKYKLMLGYRMARKLNVETGDRLMLRWRDKNGSFDAADFEIVHIFKSTVLSIDQGMVWLGLQQMHEMLKLTDEVNYFSVKKYNGDLGKKWQFKTQDDLLAEFRAVFATELTGAVFMYILLMFLAMIAVFDTQVLSLFKRRKEVGMMMALGVTRSQVIRIFTLEGLLSGLLAVILGAIWGTPLLLKFQETGLKLPEMMDSYGLDGLMDAMYPKYTIGLVFLTVVIVMTILLVVSYLPVKKISRLLPVDALKGKITNKKKAGSK